MTPCRCTEACAHDGRDSPSDTLQRCIQASVEECETYYSFDPRGELRPCYLITPVVDEAIAAAFGPLDNTRLDTAVREAVGEAAPAADAARHRAIRFLVAR